MSPSLSLSLSFSPLSFLLSLFFLFLSLTYSLTPSLSFFFLFSSLISVCLPGLICPVYLLSVAASMYFDLGSGFENWGLVSPKRSTDKGA